MTTVTLDDRDRAVLERLTRGAATIDDLATAVHCDPGYLRERLPELAENGLVRPVDGEGDQDGAPADAAAGQRYAITDSGERAISGTPAGLMDERVDTSETVERRLASMDLRPDREEAVRNAYTFLSYWGEAFDGEIVDAVYSENPAGFESAAAWWDDCVGPQLAELPDVDSPDGSEPSGESDSADDGWRYAGTPGVERDPIDGRASSDDGVMALSSGRYALETADLDDAERRAARRAFALLVMAGSASAESIRERVYPAYDAGYDSAAAWWDDCVEAAFRSLPGVTRVDEGEEVWEYHQEASGPMSSAPDPDVATEADPDADASDGPDDSEPGEE